LAFQAFYKYNEYTKVKCSANHGLSLYEHTKYDNGQLKNDYLI